MAIHEPKEDNTFSLTDILDSYLQKQLPLSSLVAILNEHFFLLPPLCDYTHHIAIYPILEDPYTQTLLEAYYQNLMAKESPFLRTLVCSRHRFTIVESEEHPYIPITLQPCLSFLFHDETLLALGIPLTQ